MAGLVLHKNAGGKTPALGGPPIRGYRYFYNRNRMSGLRETFRSIYC